ncbi:MAG: hypothetical protein P8177_12885 [Gemmatimonadota bacterium]|jgi:cytochrome c553
MPRLRVLPLLLVLALVGTASCDDDPTLPADAPAGHTVNKDGVAHAPGLSDPLMQCTDCHGQDLEGGSQGQPSCFSCHGEVW